MAVKKSLFPENHSSNPDIEDLMLCDCDFQNITKTVHDLCACVKKGTIVAVFLKTVRNYHMLELSNGKCVHSMSASLGPASKSRSSRTEMLGMV